ncbi:30S ribosomal protein S20 [Gordonia phosphorivorans]|uniref:Small ribosomal subunit protein bS20 n=1 Tax=Gordonia phosphorivorans TaxID=1056982 RepID=A0ABV6HBK3_9ACTN
MANIKSQIKRNKTNEAARQRNQSVRSALRTSIRNFRETVAGGNKDEAAAMLAATSRQLDKAASKGIIHKNQAANKKSAMSVAVNKL